MPPPIQNREDEDGTKGKHGGADESQEMITVGGVLGLQDPEPQGHAQRNGHAGGGDLWQSDTHEDQAAQDKEHADQRTSQVDEHAGIDGVPQLKSGERI